MARIHRLVVREYVDASSIIMEELEAKPSQAKDLFTFVFYAIAIPDHFDCALLSILYSTPDTMLVALEGVEKVKGVSK